jgi:hypothetical protein
MRSQISETYLVVLRGIEKFFAGSVKCGGSQAVANRNQRHKEEVSTIEVKPGTEFLGADERT